MCEPDSNERTATLSEAFLTLYDPKTVIVKTVSFENDDVPRFLEKLKAFKAISAKVNYRIG